MILAVPEYSSAPVEPAQWDRYYNTDDDTLYIQVLPTTDGSYPDWQEMEQGAAVRENMRQQITLVRSKYSAKDYQTFLDEVVAYISQRWGSSFNDFMSSDAAMMIAEYVSAAFDNMSWYLDREIDDHYMEIARVSANVARLARYLGYKSEPAVAGSVDVVATLTGAPYSFDVAFKPLHKFEGPNGLIFELGNEQVVSAGNTEITFGVYQGFTYSEVFTSDGSPNQTYSLSLLPGDEYLAKNKVSVTVDLEEWTEEDFLPYGAYQNFEVTYLTNPPRLRFGDGVIGQIPPSGSEIRVTYVATKGKTAGLATSGTINKSVTPLVVNFQTIPVEVTNPEGTSGGADSESIDSIKANAPRYFLAAERLVTKTDYDSLASMFRSASGAIAKANAVIVRGIADDLQLLSLLDALTASRAELDGYLDDIIANQASIEEITGNSSTEDTIRYGTSQAKAANIDIRSQTSLIGDQVSVVQGHIDDLKDDIALADSQLEFLPYQETIGYGDSVNTVFAKNLAMVPVKEGSFAFVVGSQTPDKTATDGDCDTIPGRLVATVSPVFSASDEGRIIRIGGQYRQIQKFLSTTTIEYSGPRIYGTSLLIDVFPPTISGYANAAGSIVASGVTGSVNHSSGAVSMSFSVAPAGISGKYGVPIVATYQYKGQAIQAVLSDADDDADLAYSNVNAFDTYGSAINTSTTGSDSIMDDIDDLCGDIEVLTSGTSTVASTAKTIPAKIQDDIDALTEYLDTVLSSECKANIVRVSCLTLDEDGFYIEPSLALKGDLKAYLDARKIVTVQNTVVGGGYHLVKAKLHIRVKILDLFTFQTVSANILVDVDNMFKGRDYGQSLNRSEYYDVIDDVDGVDYHNTEITDTEYADVLNTGTPPSVDSDGNLVVGEFEVITKWSVTIEQIL